MQAQKDACFQYGSERQVTPTTSPPACLSPWLPSKLQQGPSRSRGRITWKREFCLAGEGKWTHWSVASVMRIHQLPVVSEEDDSFMDCSSRGNFSSPWRIAITSDMFFIPLSARTLLPPPYNVRAAVVLSFDPRDKWSNICDPCPINFTECLMWSHLTSTVWTIFLLCLCKLCFKCHSGTLSSFQQRSLNSNQAVKPKK